jgi:uncharacterized protein YqeY
MGHCAEARRVRRELDEQLAATAKVTGRNLVWSAQDREVLALITSAIDRKVDLTKAYEAEEETKLRVKLSTEIRLLESHLARLLRQVQTDTPQPMSQRSLKAQRAAYARWDRDADAG